MDVGKVVRCRRCLIMGEPFTADKIHWRLLSSRKVDSISTAFKWRVMKLGQALIVAEALIR